MKNNIKEWMVIHNNCSENVRKLIVVLSMKN